MECPHCKLSTSPDDGRCTLCGWALLVCPDCGAASDTAAKHCSSCGMILGEDPELAAMETVDDGAEEHHIY